MAAFRYEALTAAGKTEAGVIEADSARHARSLVRARGLAPVAIDPIVDDAQGSGRRARGGKLRSGELALTTRQLASLLSAGLPLERALSALIEQAERPHVRDVLASVRTDVLGGQSLAIALNRYPRDFPDIYRSLVAAGEASGDLSKVLDQLATYIEDRNTLSQKVMLAFTYPAIVSGVALLVVIGLLTYVVPQVVSVFDQTKQKLPMLTVILIGISDFLRGYGWLLILAIAGGAFALRTALKQEAFRRRWDRRLLDIPIVGRLLRSLDTARFASTLAILVGGGVPILKALEAGARTVGNLAMRDDVDAAIVRVREGASLARALAAGAELDEEAIAAGRKAKGHFPPVLIHLIASGEQTGNLPDMLQRAAQGQADELSRRTLALTSLLEPALILTMGVVVLVIVLAVLLPIIEINQLVR
ncbi:MAG TPA: type II secretion system inner membrane protein GspF [Burkholderiaceae bacterium]|nr:type II secretion system inner membrane protein GspF [Burkholderiaceae bacterium]